MTTQKDERCLEIEDSIADILEGLATERMLDHLATCDACRDFKHEAENVAKNVEAAGADFRPDDGFAERMLAMVLEARPNGPESRAAVGSSGPLTGESSGARPIDARTDLANLPTEFSPRPGDHPTEIKASTFLETERASATFTPTHKTVPLSAIEAGRVGVTANSETGGVVEATTGRNNTGPSAVSGTGGGEARATPKSYQAESTLRSIEPVQTAKEAGGPKSEARGAVVPLFRRKGFLMSAAGAMAAAAAVGVLVVRDQNNESKNSAEATAWTPSVETVARAGVAGASAGVSVCTDACVDLTAGMNIEPGATVRTDAKTRTKVRLSATETISLDRNSELSLSSGDVREAKLIRGMALADFKVGAGQKPARLLLPQGEISASDAKVVATVTSKRATVEVVRGLAEVSNAGGGVVNVRAGEEATMNERGEPIVSSKSTMSDVLAWSGESSDEVDAPVLRGLGELRARKPGTQEERAGAVRLTKHDVKVRVVDVVARTTVDETFTNQTDEELEGIFRFPLPPGAQIENLALEVDGKLIDGAFVDRDRGAAIWRGVIQNAAPKAPRPKEEIVWVPGPWRDPALLEWQRGGRFELRIFPIPKRGSRRITLTYTQTVPQSAGVRRLTYPLAHDGTGNNRIDEFNVDVQVLGHDPSFGVESRGYELARSAGAAGAERFSLHETNFIPSGDLTMEYALPNRSSELIAWAYDPPAVSAPQPSVVASGAPPSKATLAAEESAARMDITSPYVALSIRPKLPRFPEGKERLHVIVVDSSRSMVGERYARATRLAAGIVREMDRRDQFMVLACDTTCQAMGTTLGRSLPSAAEPSAEAAGQVESFLGSIEPDGGSNLLAAMQAARAAGGAAGGRELRVLYLGDGTPTVGPSKPSTIEAAVRHALPHGQGSVIAVALGADADSTSLAALARGGNGVVVPYVPGQRVGAAAVDVLASAYGSVLSDIEVVLPPGLQEVTPRRLDPIPAGGETFILARMNGKSVEGTVTLRGRIGDERFEQSYPASVVASSSAGNAFIPRMFAAAKIAELEQTDGQDARHLAVALSQRFNVASRHTSLIVLESETMFKAFGLSKNGLGSQFTGEDTANSSSAEEIVTGAQQAEDDLFAGDKSKESGFGRGGLGLTDLEESPTPRPASKSAVASEGKAAPAPAATFAPGDAAGPAMAPSRSKDSRPDPFAESQQARPGWGGGRRPPSPPRRLPPDLVPMRKVFDRKASFQTTNVLATELVTVLASAESSQRLAPDSRDKTIALYRALMASGRVGEALELVSRWSQRDALDADALMARADLAAMNGERERSLRILSGLSDLRPGDKAVQKRLIQAFTSLGALDLACQHRMALAEIDGQNDASVAAAVRCSSDQGFIDLSNAYLRGAPAERQKAIETTAQGLKLRDLAAPVGDVRLSAKWSQPVDLDLALIDKNGRRFALTGSTASASPVSTSDAASPSQETLAVANLPSGQYVVEVVRSRTQGSTQQPVTGELTFNLPGGEVSRATFTLVGSRVEVGSVRVFFTSRLVPVSSW